LNGDLVVDCCGVDSHTSWFKKFGVDIPISSVKSRLAYSSTLVLNKSRKEETQDSKNNSSTETPPNKNTWSILYYQQIPPSKPVCIFIMKIQANEYLLSTVGINGAPAPRTFSELLSLSKEQFPVAYEFLSQSEPVGDGKLVFYPKEGNVFKHYQKINVHGYVVIGDAMTSFNPVYGQGMTTSAESCLLLDHLLRTAGYNDKFCSVFHARRSRQATVPWILASLSDLRFEKTTISAPQGWFTSNWLTWLKPFSTAFLERMVARGAVDPLIHKTFIAVVHMKENYLYSFLNPMFWRNLFFD